MSWETVIGLEIHAQLATQSKIFSGAPTRYGAGPNTQACLVDLGYPGVLPVLNRGAVVMAVKFGLAVGATIAPRSVFARKNYFYPDLPKGYQISQYELPVVTGGSLEIVTEDGEVRGIDLNRAGTPLLEIVSEPELRSAKEATAYMKAMHTLVRYLGICDGNMQEGSFRCDANVSVRRAGDEKLGTRTELKNLNSFRFLERAINFEVERQIEVLEDGGAVVQETRLYDAQRDETRPMRTKEEANDYRYFPDPDLLPVQIDRTLIETVRKTLPELPDAKRRRLGEQYSVKPDDAVVLAGAPALADYFEAVAAASGSDGQTVANWVLGELSAALNRDGLDIAESRIGPAGLAQLLDRIADGTLSGKLAT